MLAKHDVVVDDAFVRPSTAVRRAILTVARSQARLRRTRCGRPVADVACTVSAALVVEGPSGLALAFVVLALLGLASDWTRPVPLSVAAPGELRGVAVRSALPALALLPFSPSAPAAWLALGAGVGVVL